MKSLTGISFLLLALTLNPSSASAIEPTLAKSGGKIFNKFCSSCHGTNGTGNGPTASALKVKPADLTTISKRSGGEFPSAKMAAIIDGENQIVAHGDREMPVWGHQFRKDFGGGTFAEEASRGNITVLVEYLKSIQK